MVNKKMRVRLIPLRYLSEIAERMYPDLSEEVLGASLFDVLKRMGNDAHDYLRRWYENEVEGILKDAGFLGDALEQMDAPDGCECDAENAAACTCFATDKGGNPIRLDKVKPEDAPYEYPSDVWELVAQNAAEVADFQVRDDLEMDVYDSPESDEWIARAIGVSSDWIYAFSPWDGEVLAVHDNAGVVVNGRRMVVCVTGGADRAEWFPFMDAYDGGLETRDGFYGHGYDECRYGGMPLLTLFGAVDGVFDDMDQWPEDLPALIIRPDCSLTLTGFDGDVPVLTVDEWIGGFKGCNNPATDKLVCMVQNLALASGGIVPAKKMLADLCKALPLRSRLDAEAKRRILSAATPLYRDPRIALQTLIRVDEQSPYRTDFMLDLYRQFVRLSAGLSGWTHCVIRSLDVDGLGANTLFDGVELSARNMVALFRDLGSAAYFGCPDPVGSGVFSPDIDTVTSIVLILGPRVQFFGERSRRAAYRHLSHLLPMINTTMRYRNKAPFWTEITAAASDVTIELTLKRLIDLYDELRGSGDGTGNIEATRVMMKGSTLIRVLVVESLARPAIADKSDGLVGLCERYMEAFVFRSTGRMGDGDMYVQPIVYSHIVAFTVMAIAAAAIAIRNGVSDADFVSRLKLRSMVHADACKRGVDLGPAVLSMICGGQTSGPRVACSDFDIIRLPDVPSLFARADDSDGCVAELLHLVGMGCIPMSAIVANLLDVASCDDAVLSRVPFSSLVNVTRFIAAELKDLDDGLWNEVEWLTTGRPILYGHLDRLCAHIRDRMDDADADVLSGIAA